MKYITVKKSVVFRIRTTAIERKERKQEAGGMPLGEREELIGKRRTERLDRRATGG